MSGTRCYIIAFVYHFLWSPELWVEGWLDSSTSDFPRPWKRISTQVSQGVSHSMFWDEATRYNWRPNQVKGIPLFFPRRNKRMDGWPSVWINNYMDRASQTFSRKIFSKSKSVQPLQRNPCHKAKKKRSPSYLLGAFQEVTGPVPTTRDLWLSAISMFPWCPDSIGKATDKHFEWWFACRYDANWDLIINREAGNWIKTLS